MDATETIDTYNFNEDALGLGDFVTSAMASLSDEEIVVYVEDAQGNPAKQARFVRKTLSDGSTVVNLVISFES